MQTHANKCNIIINRFELRRNELYGIIGINSFCNDLIFLGCNIPQIIFSRIDSVDRIALILKCFEFKSFLQSHLVVHKKLSSIK